MSQKAQKLYSTNIRSQKKRKHMKKNEELKMWQGSYSSNTEEGHKQPERASSTDLSTTLLSSTYLRASPDIQRAVSSQTEEKNALGKGPESKSYVKPVSNTRTLNTITLCFVTHSLW